MDIRRDAMKLGMVGGARSAGAKGAKDFFRQDLLATKDRGFRIGKSASIKKRKASEAALARGIYSKEQWKNARAAAKKNKTKLDPKEIMRKIAAGWKAAGAKP